MVGRVVTEKKMTTTSLNWCFKVMEFNDTKLYNKDSEFIYIRFEGSKMLLIHVYLEETKCLITI